jgi:hypothetical protein
MTAPRQPVTPDDLRAAARLCLATLQPVQDRDWSIPALGLRWTCRATLDHICDCLAWYAHDLASELQSINGAARRGFPRAPIAELLFSVGALAEVLALVGAAKGADARGWHDWGVADAEGFVAMGTIEILLHTWDIASAFDLPLSDPDQAGELAGRLVPRLFPSAPVGPSPFDSLLAATGRPRPPGKRRAPSWQWHSAPLTDR